MEFAMKTLVTFMLLAIGTLVIILFIQVWSGNSIDIVDSVYEFFRGMTGIG